MISAGLTPASIVLYCGFVFACLASIFWRPIVGIYFLVPLIPLQTTRYYLIGLPLGQSVVDITVLAVIIGLLLHSQRIFPTTPWNALLLIYGIFTFISLCLGSFYLKADLPFALDNPRLADWKNAVVMLLLPLLVMATVQSPRQMKILILLMCLATLVLNRGFLTTIAEHDLSSYSEGLRDAGGMGYAGVNGFAAYESQLVVFLLALAAFRDRFLATAGYLGLGLLSVICVMYSFSRGAYLGLLGGCFFLGIVKQRRLLILLIIFLCTWTSVVPDAVQQRVLMTYDESSGEFDHSVTKRIELWNQAAEMFQANPIIGAGFDTYFYTSHLYDYKDSHNYYLKVLAETGVVGLALFLWLLGQMFWKGYSLFRIAKDPFVASLGLGLAAWVACCVIVNSFGDRWTFLQVNGYMWVIAGLVARGWILERQSVTSVVKKSAATEF